MNSMAGYSVIDANLALRGVLPLHHSQRVTDWLEERLEAGVRIAVPGLWLLEVTSTIHRLMMQRQIGREEAEAVLEALLGLPVEVFQEDADLCRKAFGWASRLGQFAVYDSVYLALSERLNADFYTADKRLSNRCREIGAAFVKLVE
mgnify:CR=1 FL=1